MAQIKINEISQNYQYNVGANSYATVALPITACWGPAFVDPTSVGKTAEEVLEASPWQRFPSTSAGVESFISTYRGPASNYRAINDYSYQMALTLLNAGYDILVNRLCPGTYAQGMFTGSNFKALQEEPNDWLSHKTSYYKVATYNYTFDLIISNPGEEKWKQMINAGEVYDSVSHEQITDENTVFAVAKYSRRIETPETYTNCTSDDSFVKGKIYELQSPYMTVKAKYPGTFGNNLICKINQIKASSTSCYWNLVVYVVNDAGQRTAVENLVFVYDEDNSTDSIPSVNEIESNFITLIPASGMDDDDSSIFTRGTEIQLSNGVDVVTTEGTGTLAKSRLPALLSAYYVDGQYFTAANQYVQNSATPGSDLNALWHKTWLYIHTSDVLSALSDKLTYNPDRIISPGWDDQDISAVNGTWSKGGPDKISPMHKKMMDIAYLSRCATAMLDIPSSATRASIYNETDDKGYAQMLSKYTSENYANDATSIFVTNSTLFGPWGKFKYAGMSKMKKASPSFLALMIERSMISNQSIQYKWLLPTTRRSTVDAKLDYNIPKNILDQWQSLEGVGVNAIINLPDQGTTVWGNSTLYDVPPATYQALSNLSTRYLINAIKDQVFRCGIAITFQYNNEQAYSAFFAGMSPLLTTMQNCGAIDDYYIRMSADIDALDSVNSNSIVGQILLTIHGVVNDITVDLVALPTSVSLDQYRA